MFSGGKINPTSKKNPNLVLVGARKGPEIGVLYGGPPNLFPAQLNLGGVLSGETVSSSSFGLHGLGKFRHSLRHETFNYDHLSTARLVYRHGAIAYLAQSC